MSIKYIGDIDLAPYDALVELRRKIDKTAGYLDPKPKLMGTVDAVARVTREEREKRHLSKEQLAQTAGVSMRTIDELEDRGYTRYALAEPVFHALHIKPVTLPMQFAQEDMKADLSGMALA